MNSRLTTLSLLAALLVAPTAPAAPTRVATTAEYTRGQTADQVIGQDVSTLTGQKIGEVQDLLIDHDGRIVYAVIASGGVLGVGKVYRAVPFAAFTRTRADASGPLQVDLHNADWNKAPLVRLDQIDSLASAERGGEVFRYYGRDWNEAHLDAATGRDALKLVSAIDGQQVVHDGQHVGKIEDVIVDGDHVFALLNADRAYTTAGKQFALPIRELSWSTPESTVANTRFTPEDFAKAQPLTGDMAVDASTPYWWDYAGVSNPADAHAPAPITSDAGQTVAVRTPVADIEQKLHDDPSLAPAATNVTLQPTGNQLVLTGQVATETLRSRITETVRQAANGWDVRDQLTVRAATE